MKNILTLIAFSLSLTSFSQNTLPIIQITSVEVDQVEEEVTINYNLAAADNCEVWLKFSEDGGEYFEVAESVSGTVGDEIAPAEGLTLTWSYANLGGSIADVQIKLFASDHLEVSIQEMVDAIDENQILSYLEDVVGERHHITAPAALEDVRGYITDAFTDAQLQTEDHNFTYESTLMKNILGRKPGAKDEAVTYIIDGHFDGVPGSPAADDNGTAVAGVLECLRVLSQYQFEHSIRFIGFDAEELGLIGSYRYNLNGIKPYEELEGVLNFEMIGYYSDQPYSQTLPEGFGILFPEATAQVVDDEFRGNFITVVGNVDSNPLISAYESAATTYVPDLRVISVAVPGNGTIAPDLRRSDHSTFWDAGYQAVMLTDGSEFRNQNYHTPNDVIDSLHMGFLTDVVKATLATAAQLAVPIRASSDHADLSTIVGLDDHNHGFPATVGVYPNPTDGLVTLEISNALHDFRARVEVFSLDGKRVNRQVLQFATGDSKTQLDLSTLSPGTYILNLLTSEASTSLSLVIE